MSVKWFTCAANLRYSNYDKGPQPVLEMLKTCLSMQGVAIDEKSFGRVKSPVKADYISQLNDNLFTTVRYLLHKLYYFQKKDSSIKFLVYDWFSDMFKLIDLKDRSTMLGTFATVLSLMKTNMESLI